VGYPIRVVVVAPRPMKIATTRSPWRYLLSAARAVLIWSMHSDQSSSITSVSAPLSALRNVTSTGAGCFFLSSVLIIATPFWQSDLLSANAPVALIIMAAVAASRAERSMSVFLVGLHPGHAARTPTHLIQFVAAPLTGDGPTATQS